MVVTENKEFEEEKNTASVIELREVGAHIHPIRDLLHDYHCVPFSPGASVSHL